MKKIKLGDVLEIKRGASLSGNFYSEEGNLIRLTLGNFDYPRGGFKENSAKKNIFFTGAVNKHFILNKGDIITPLTEQVSGLLGETAFIPESEKYIQSGDIGLVIPNENKLDKIFSYYLVSSSIVRKQLDSSSQQTKIRHTTPDFLKSCITWIPEKISEQKQIGNFLYSLDQKIALNKKINATLEDMAKTFFLHKFFRKPANGKIADILIENAKSTVPVGVAKNSIGDFPFFTSGENILRFDSFLVDGRNIFLNTGGNAGVSFYVGKSHYSTDTWCISTKNLSDYLYLTLKVIEPELNKKFFQGTGLKHLQKDLLKKFSIYIPTDQEREQFNNFVCPLFDTISKNQRENNLLENLRDFLLPMLMNEQVTFAD